MENCLVCSKHKKIPIVGSGNDMKNVRCYYLVNTLRDGKIPLEMYLGLYGEGIKKEIKPPKGCPLNCEEEAQ